MQITLNYGLKKPEGTDVVNIDDFNYNADIMDTELAKKASSTQDGKMAKEDYSKLSGISAGANKVETSTTNGNVKIDSVEKIVYIHPGSGTNPHGTTKSDVGLGNLTNDAQVKRSEMGANSGVATLDSSGVNAQVPRAHTHTKTQISDFPASLPASGGNADTVSNYAPGNASGTIPVSNGALNTNLNSDMVDGKHASDFATVAQGTKADNALAATEVVTTPTANKVLRLDVNSKLPGNITGNADGNAATATKWQTARTIGISGDASGSASLDGSANATITLVLANSGATAGTFTKVTIDAKGRVTSATTLSAADIPNLDWSKITSGKPTTLAGYGIGDAAPSSHIGSTGSAHGAATSSINGFMSSSDKSKLDGISSNANNYVHPTSGVTTGTYQSVTVDVNGHVTSGTKVPPTILNPMNWVV